MCVVGVGGVGRGVWGDGQKSQTPMTLFRASIFGSVQQM